MMESPYFAQGEIGIMIVWLIQWLKRLPWFPWVAERTAAANRLISAVLALASASLIHYSWDSTEGTLVITGLTLANTVHFLFAAAGQFCGQEVLYQMAYHKEKP